MHQLKLLLQDANSMRPNELLIEEIIKQSPGATIVRDDQIGPRLNQAVAFPLVDAAAVCSSLATATAQPPYFLISSISTKPSPKPSSSSPCRLLLRKIRSTIICLEKAL